MYIPKIFQFESHEEKLSFIKKYSFATIVTVKDDIPIATHLPFYIDDSSDKLVLRAHFSSANEHAKCIEGNLSLVIFTGPNAYISTNHYNKLENVPTWDYTAVHAYGEGRIVTDEDDKHTIIKQMVAFYETPYVEQWNNLSEKYKTKMLAGITVFELEVTDLQGKKKLSQNRDETERQRIIEHLNKSTNTTESELSPFISKLNENNK